MARSRASEGKTKANLLKNVDLSSILTPAKPAPHIAGTKGERRSLGSSEELLKQLTFNVFFL